MKRWGLLLTTLASLVVTACVLYGTGWGRRSAHAVPTADGVTTAAWHYFHSGPRHWRNCMLHP
jgi:hypothetical protein